MNPNLIFELVELAISLGQTQLDGGEVAHTLLDIIQKAVRAYEDHSGEPLNPELIKAGEPL